MLSEAEIDELDKFLLSEATSEGVMQLDCLDGYLTAIVSGPTSIKMSQWLPRVWGASVNDEPVFETMAQATRIVDLILRHMSSIVSSLQLNPELHEPIFDNISYVDDPREYTDAEMWACGYMQGIAFCRQDWQAFFDEPHAEQVIRPIYLLGSDEVQEAEEVLIESAEQREEWSKQIPASLVWIYRYWQPYRQAVVERMVATTIMRDQPKIGRNDPCSCGSGKKFKKCCGASSVLH